MSDLNEDLIGHLRETHVAVQLACSPWMGMTKSMGKEQKSRVAELFGADVRIVSGGSKLFSKHEILTAINSVRSRAKSYFKAMTLPFPVDNTRLLKRERLQEFSDALVALVAELDQHVAQANDALPELLELARADRGDLFDRAQYPNSFTDAFALKWEPVSVEPPDWLREASPRLYQQFQSRVYARFGDAIDMAEQAFLTEFNKLVQNLSDNLIGGENGQAKAFKPNSINNLVKFFDQFKQVSVRSSEDLDALVEKAQNVVRGVSYDKLKENGNTQIVVGESLRRIGEELNGMLQARSSRVICFED